MRVDFVILELQIILEADSYEFHSHRYAFDKDKMRSAILSSNGWLVLKITMSMNRSLIKKMFLDMQRLRVNEVLVR
jgi:very-short-patch-repair endonuclease